MPRLTVEVWGEYGAEIAYQLRQLADRIEDNETTARGANDTSGYDCQPWQPAPAEQGPPRPMSAAGWQQEDGSALAPWHFFPSAPNPSACGRVWSGGLLDRQRVARERGNCPACIAALQGGRHRPKDWTL